MKLFLKPPYFIGGIELSRSGRDLFQGRHHNLFGFDTVNVQAKQKVDIQASSLDRVTKFLSKL